VVAMFQRNSDALSQIMLVGDERSAVPRNGRGYHRRLDPREIGQQRRFQWETGKPNPMADRLWTGTICTPKDILRHQFVPLRQAGPMEALSFPGHRQVTLGAADLRAGNASFMTNSHTTLRAHAESSGSAP
jgi:hypothetical protein